MSAVLFHVMQSAARSASRIVVWRMKLDGSHDVLLPAGRTVEQAWPLYRRATARYLDVWFDETVSKPVSETNPGDEGYPRALAVALTNDTELNYWAYATSVTVEVSFRQVANALGQEATPELRAEMEGKGLAFAGDASGYSVSISRVAKVLGAQAADQVLMYPRQAADFLGVHTGSVSGILTRVGIGSTRDDMMVAPWGKLRRVKRVGPRKFEFSGNGDGA